MRNSASHARSDRSDTALQNNVMVHSINVSTCSRSHSDALLSILARFIVSKPGSIWLNAMKARRTHRRRRGGYKERAMHAGLVKVCLLGVSLLVTCLT
jgi:hypothetical protein